MRASEPTITLADFFHEDFVVGEIDNAISRDDRKTWNFDDADVPYVAVLVPQHPSPPRNALAVEGMRVQVDGDGSVCGVVFKITALHVAVGYDDMTWDAMTHDTFQQRASAEPASNFNVNSSVAALLVEPHGNKKLLPSAFLFDVTKSETLSAWQLYQSYSPGADADEPECFAPAPLSFSLCSGDVVKLLAAVVPLAAPGARGPKRRVTGEEPPGTHFYFMGLLLGKAPAEKSWRRWAMIKSIANDKLYLAPFNAETIVNVPGEYESKPLCRDVAKSMSLEAFQAVCDRGVKAVAGSTSIQLNTPSGLSSTQSARSLRPRDHSAASQRHHSKSKLATRTHQNQNWRVAT